MYAVYHMSVWRVVRVTASSPHLKEEMAMSNFSLIGKKALVTGGAQGLGAGMARALKEAGAAVVIGDIKQELGKQTAAELGVGFVSLDVANEDSWRAAVEQTISELGGLDVVVNNAGVEVSSLVVDLDPAGLRTMLEVNVVGTALGVKHALRAMRPGGAAGHGGSVINISSVAASIAFPGVAGYSATKSGIDRFSRVAAQESGQLGYGVRVNCVYPGLVPTEMGTQVSNDMVRLGLAPDFSSAMGGVVDATPLGRLAEVGDIADAVVFLASDAARFITGTGVTVDGGMSM
jgi:NAD(P)-dependent dehydrogenase (short-subunit alcohol dehydrogenase family)